MTVRAFFSWACLALMLYVCAAPPARADVVQEYVYEAGKTFQVRTALGITTQIALVADEAVEDYSVGFSGGWDVSRRGNVLYVRPKNVDVDTNLIVRTQSRTYIIDLKVVSSNWKKLDQVKQAGVQYRVTFAPGAKPGTANRHTPSTARETTPASVAAKSFEPSKQYNFDYAMARSTGADALAPRNVYDDGAFTFLLLKRGEGKSGMVQPAVFARRTPEGGDMVVNSHVDGDSVVVHGVYPYLALRNGKQLVLIRRNPKK